MKAEVFDDRKSIVHAIAGVATYFFRYYASYSSSMNSQNTCSDTTTSVAQSVICSSSVPGLL